MLNFKAKLTSNVQSIGNQPFAQHVTKNKKFEYLWKVMFIAISIICVFLLQKVYQFRTLPEFQHQRKGNCLTFLLYGGLFTILYILLHNFWHATFDQWVQNNFITLQRYKDPVTKKNRAYTLARMGYFIVFYTISSFSGYEIIKDTEFFPEALGGKGSVFTLISSRDLSQATNAMEMYYFVQFGKHFGRCLIHMFIRPEGSYFEYCLHHSLAIFLILFSYSGNMWIIGIFILILHDYSDFGLNIARAYKDYRHNNQFILQIVYVHAVGGWVLLRVFIFSYFCVYACWHQYINLIGTLAVLEQQVLGPCYLFMCIMLLCLEIMHLYWTYYVFRSAVQVNISKQLVKHNYD